VNCLKSFAAPALEFSISFDKTEYKKGDSINVEYKIENISKSPFYVNKRFFVNSEKSNGKEREIYFNITSPSKEKLVFKQELETGLPKSDYFVLLNADEEIASERPRNVKYYFEFDVTGQYEIVGVYQNSCGEEIGLDVYKEKVVSEKLFIIVTE
ncbi:MAG: hypothetical protein KAI91_07685, partial [Candidatus Omnitrophica bacterium]|nr:hypothetical protein [Candidatus Omnitrophota bacterium]